MECYWMLILLSVSMIPPALSFQTGAPQAACQTLAPDATRHGAQPQVSKVPYILNLSALYDQETDRMVYIPDIVYNAVLESTAAAPSFRGFLIQARLVADGTTVVGQFEEPPAGGDYRYGSCTKREGSVTHTSRSEKSTLVIPWRAPSSGTGTIHFGYAVVQTRQLYWANQRSVTIEERPCELPSYVDRRLNSCVRQCPLFFFGNHTTGLCQPFPDVLPNGVQADATAYFGRIVTNATLGTEVFRFRIVIDPSRYGGDLDAIITVINRDNTVLSIFRLSDDQSSRTFTFISGINAANASGLLPSEIRVLENGLVVFEDFVIYRQAPPPELEIPITLEFDLIIIVVGRGGTNTLQTDFAVGTVDLIPPSQDQCASDPCLNGTCENLVDDFRCLCYPGWTGSLCDTDIDYCGFDPSPYGPCDDTGAVGCNDDNSTYICTCVNGFTGVNCSVDIDDCDPNPCENGGNCTNFLFGVFYCECRQGYSGHTCATDSTPCDPQPCLNGGTCNDLRQGVYSCSCDQGFTGQNCITDLDFCHSDTCLNGGTCVEGFGTETICNCTQEFAGDRCNILLLFCTPDSCQNGGTCDDSGGLMITCSCADGYDGIICDQDDPYYFACTADPCLNGGTCVEEFGPNSSCNCIMGFDGNRCENDLPFCLPDSCLNGGTCVEGYGTAVSCNCTDGFEGDQCENDRPFCQPDSCLNGGTCVEGYGTDTTCNCTQEFAGDHCNKLLENGGNCTNFLFGASERCSAYSNLCAPSEPCSDEVVCPRGMYNCYCLCIAQCPLFTFGNHTTGYCQPFPEHYGGVQANATAYYGSVSINTANGTVAFAFQLIINLGRFDNDLEYIDVTLVQRNYLSEKIFSFSNYQQERHFSINKHGGIDAVNASNTFPEITLINNRTIIYEDFVIYSQDSNFFVSSINLPSRVNIDLNVVVLGINTGNFEERTPFADAIVTLIQDLSQDRIWCQSDIDNTWGIAWPITFNSSSASQPCPGINTTGFANRYCDGDGYWREVDVIGCSSIEIMELQNQAEIILSSEDQVTEIAELTQQLAQATQPRNLSLLPHDLQTSSEILSTIVGILEANNVTSNNVIDVFNNVLDDSNREGWRVLQTNGMVMASEMLLQSAEQYALLVAMSANMIEEEEGAHVFRQSRQNIAITGRQYNRPPSADIHFPNPSDLINFTKGENTSNIRIRQIPIRERFEESKEGENLPVSFTLLRNFPVNNAFSNTQTQASNCPSIENMLKTSAQNVSPTVTSDVIIGQVGATRKDWNSPSLQTNPIGLNFTFETTQKNISDYHYHCAYWSFSDPIGNGSWTNDGVMTSAVDVIDGNTTMIQCTSTHLTSFAVLVSVAKGLEDVKEAEHTALKAVSYIGCSVSIVCLTLTVIFFIWRGKLFNSENVLFFIHFNLAVSLLIAILVFVLGIETASKNAIGCMFVAALLHYLFLSAFCWMLCEGIMLYLLLHIVFSNMAKKWWPFLLIGYLTPLPIVIITVGIRFKDYGVKDTCGTLLYCWLSIQNGTIFGFVGPMLAIIAMNVLFLMLALRAGWRSKQRSLTKLGSSDHTLKDVQKLGKFVFIGSLVLLPLLGLTWVFGILAVNANSTLFAWLFTIFNSTQGLFIFLFHVVQSNEVRSKVGSKLCSKRKAAQRSMTYARWRSTPHGSVATLTGIGLKETITIDQTKVSSVALATECDNLDDNDLKSVEMAHEKSDHGFV